MDNSSYFINSINSVNRSDLHFASNSTMVERVFLFFLFFRGCSPQNKMLLVNDFASFAFNLNPSKFCLTVFTSLKLGTSKLFRFATIESSSEFEQIFSSSCQTNSSVNLHNNIANSWSGFQVPSPTVTCNLPAFRASPSLISPVPLARNTFIFNRPFLSCPATGGDGSLTASVDLSLLFSLSLQSIAVNLCFSVVDVSSAMPLPFGNVLRVLFSRDLSTSPLAFCKKSNIVRVASPWSTGSAIQSAFDFAVDDVIVDSVVVLIERLSGLRIDDDDDLRDGMDCSSLMSRRSRIARRLCASAISSLSPAAAFSSALFWRDARDRMLLDVELSGRRFLGSGVGLKTSCPTCRIPAHTASTLVAKIGCVVRPGRCLTSDGRHW